MLDTATFLTTVYVLADEFNQTQPPPPRRPGPHASLSCSEVLTLALFSQWRWFSSERDFYRYAVRHLRAAFPGLPDRSQFNRLLRQQQARIASFALVLAQALNASEAAYEVLDSAPVPTRTHKRGGRGWLPGLAAIGYSKRLGWYTGLHLLLAVTPSGIITGYGAGPANANDRHLAETLFAVRQQPDPRLPSAGQHASSEYLADTGFGGRERVAHWLETYAVQVHCPPQPDSTYRVWPQPLRRELAGRRQIVETVVARLLDTFRLRQERPHALDGFQARLAAKVAMHNLCMWLNQQLGRPLLAFVDLMDW